MTGASTGPALPEFWSRLGRVLVASPVRSLTDPDLTRSAVVLPLFEGDGTPRLLMVRRAAHLSRHAGEIAFPGGVIEPSDTDALSAALRETEEEIDVGASALEVLGRLDDTPTGLGYCITPFVARLHALPSHYRLSPEIHSVVTPALTEFLDPRRHRTERRTFRGRVIDVSFYNCDEGVVWGASAHIIEDLVERMRRGGLLPDRGRGDDGADG